MDLFNDVIPSLTNVKNNLLDKNPDEEKNYVAFMVNKHFGYSAETVLFANEMNVRWDLDNKLQYDFYFYGLPKKKLWIKYPVTAKQKEDERKLNNLDVIQKYYNCSEIRAKEYAKILNENQIATIKERLDEGGIATRKSK